MKTSLRTAFNEDAQNYDIARPDYPEELFTDILSYLDERNAGKTALEIGIGTGQATKPFLDAGFQVTAIELGDNLAAYETPPSDLETLFFDLGAEVFAEEMSLAAVSP